MALHGWGVQSIPNIMAMEAGSRKVKKREVGGGGEWRAHKRAVGSQIQTWSREAWTTEFQHHAPTKACLGKYHLIAAVSMQTSSRGAPCDAKKQGSSFRIAALAPWMAQHAPNSAHGLCATLAWLMRRRCAGDKSGTA